MNKVIKNTLPFLNHPHPSEKSSITFENTEDFLFLPEIHSAKKYMYKETVTLLFFLMILASLFFIVIKIFLNIPILIGISALIAFLYLFLMLFKLIVVVKSLRRQLISFSESDLSSIKDEELPIYTIVLPLLEEEKVVPQIINAMNAIDYPKEKLEIIITLEEYDTDTIQAIKKLNPPNHFDLLILPNVKPKTKPKALNVAFREARGEFLVIYDAEIIPEPQQLKKAFLAFTKFKNIGCLQTRLDHYNSEQNIITRLFNAEFSFYYDLFLPGLQSLGYPIPLSGHSTHFRTQALKTIGAWDPYNVAEDCDVGIRMYRLGFKTDILDSISHEEATSGLRSWMHQRTRWMKGFIQTSIVHLRHPLRLKNEVGGTQNFLGFLFTVPGTVVINILNLFYWVLLLAWIATKSDHIQYLFPTPILYISIISFVMGNVIFTFLNLIGTYKRRRYAMVKYCLLSPIYWILLALATVRATIQIILKPHYWEKTSHRSHL